MGFVTVGDLARRYNVSPPIITNLFYYRKLDVNRCPIVGGRRLIPKDYVGIIEEKLRSIGLLETCNAG
jgi:hypothetical protein